MGAERDNRAASKEIPGARREKIHGGEDTTIEALTATFKSRLNGLLMQRAKPEHLSYFFFRLKTLIEAGVALERSVSILAAQEDVPRLARIYGDVAAQLRQGRSLSASLARHSETFSRITCALVEVGERGHLTRALDEAAQTLAHLAEVRARLAQAVRYPALVCVVSLLLAFAMFRWILPAFVLAPGASASALTGLLALGVGATHGRGLALLLITSTIVGVLLYRWAANGGPARLEPLLLRIPVIGKLSSQFAQLQIARALAAQIRCGVNLRSALLQSRDVTWSLRWAEILSRAELVLREGRPPSEALQERDCPHARLLLSMLQLGEQSGDLPGALDQAARLLKEDTDQGLTGVLQTVEPLLILGAGCVTALILIAALGPVYAATLVT